MADDDEKVVSRNTPPSPPSTTTPPTLLPSPIASLVSLATRSSSLYLSVGTYLGGLAIDGARITTLTGLDLSRAVVESILVKAGRDVTSHSSGELGKAEAESLLERSIATLHSTLSQASFLVATGFHVSSATLASASTLSLHVLAALDSVLGSTESSRAIASIVTLIRREFENPETGVKGERVGVVDLIVGISGLALLQRWCFKTTQREIKDGGIEEAVWDVVILDDGRRADVIGLRSAAPGSSPQDAAHAAIEGEGSRKRGGAYSFMEMSGQAEVFDAIQRDDDAPQNGALAVRDSDAMTAWPEASIRDHILAQLPPNANVSITTETVTTKTITVEVTGAEPADIAPPPGVYVVEENAHQIPATEDHEAHGTEYVSAPIPWYRVVYRTINNRLRSTTMEPTDGPASLARLTDSDTTGPDRSALDDDNSRLQTSPRISPLTSPEPDAVADGETGYFTESTFSDDAEPVQVYADDPPRPTRGAAARKTPLSTRVNAANQKRPRKPASPPPPYTEPEKSNALHLKMSLPKHLSKSRQPSPEKVEKKESSRKMLKKGGSISNLANIWNRDSAAPPVPPAAKSKDARPPWGSNRAGPALTAVPGSKKPSQSSSQLPVPRTTQSKGVTKTALPHAPQRGNPNYFSSRDLGQRPEPPRSPSRASYYSVHQRRRDSLVSQTDTYSIHSVEPSRPASPNQTRSQARPTSSLMRSRSEKNVYMADVGPASPRRGHQKSKSYIPSIYTLNTNNSETSLVRADRHGRSAFDNSAAVMALHHSGHIDGLFPRAHLVRNMTRYVRFASASYGANFLRVMGIASSSAMSNTTSTKLVERDLLHHAEHHSFSSHTRLPPSTILLSSFVDPQGGSNAAGETNTGVPLVHYVSLDHDSHAVVLTCRGTLGFEDVLTDMTCDYDDLTWRGRDYRVHKGIHASARRLLYGGGGRVMATIKAALEEFPEYGLVLCGHSLGGGVAALLAIMISEPNVVDPAVSAFVTLGALPKSPMLLTSSTATRAPPPAPEPLRLPGGRPVHVYAYGPPATIAPALRLATRGLITTVVNGQDLVPQLSLGLLRDLQAVALAFKTDTSNAKAEVRQRVWEGLSSGLTERIYGDRAGLVNEQDDQWAYSALKGLRASMMSPKLYPPGEVFVVETQRVLQREAFTPTATTGDFGPGNLGRPATRAVLKYVRDVERRFGEIRFGVSMLGDHSPGRYELSLAALGKGVLDDDES
ncbi:MAG: hypothetical protein M1838_001668 [Thelocarpon superellum]|nr:MAG: hypothetical protein M1838_001668 [Thelocarpon superellum]